MSDRICQTCRYWSEMVASFTVDLEALCLNDANQRVGKMTWRHETCPARADGVLGAIDTPGVEPDALMKAYAAFDEAQA